MAEPQQGCNVARIGKDDSFCFACHKELSCFTECCRLLELALTPYDVVRLRKATGHSSSEFLEKFVIIEQQPGEPFPRLYLSMVDDGRASCVFVTKDGCAVYEHRPGACRTYPLGRAVKRTASGTEEHFILMKEQHCKGLEEIAAHTPRSYCTDQQLPLYNQFNDALLGILQHQSIRDGYLPSKNSSELFLLALYDLDRFREKVLSGDFGEIVASQQEKVQLQDDEYLLQFATVFLQRKIFT